MDLVKSMEKEHVGSEDYRHTLEDGTHLHQFVCSPLVKKTLLSEKKKSLRIIFMAKARS